MKLKSVLITAVVLLSLVGLFQYRFHRPPLHSAAARGDTAEVARLLAEGHDTSRRSYSFGTDMFTGWTPLMWAVWNAHPETVKVLIDDGADINAEARLVSSILFLAVSPGTGSWWNRGRNWDERTECARLLLEAGADPNQPLRIGPTPLQQAVLSKSVPLVSLLLDHGADVNAGLDSESERSALFWSVSAQPDEAITELLLSRGARLGRDEKDVASFLRWVREEADRIPPEVVRLIEDAAAKHP